MEILVYTKVGIRCSADHSTIRNCNITSNFNGIHVFDNWGWWVENCDIYSNYNGVFFENSGGTVSSCSIRDNFNHGIVFFWAGGSIISACKIYDNNFGIHLVTSEDNYILENEIVGNTYGIRFEYYSRNTYVYHNKFQYNDNSIYLNLSSNNFIHHNNFHDSYVHDDENNTWDNGYPSGGNYWIDYTGSDSNGDSLGDTPYNISGGSNQDHYPLMQPEWYATNLCQGWNFISLPQNQTIDKNQLRVCSGFDDYRWPDAVALGWVSGYLFGWDRNSQTYTFADTIEPGYGCWLYSYDEYELWVQCFSAAEDNYITNLEENWNIIGIPFDESVDKSDLIVTHNGTNYNWSDAVAQGLVSDYLFGWDGNAQSYVFADTLEPGHCYWLYAYQECTLRRAV